MKYKLPHIKNGETHKWNDAPRKLYWQSSNVDYKHITVGDVDGVPETGCMSLEWKCKRCGIRMERLFSDGIEVEPSYLFQLYQGVSDVLTHKPSCEEVIMKQALE